MKLAIVILAMVGVSMACDSRRVKDKFEAFRRQYRKYYATVQEENYRCSVFEVNLNEVEGHNLRQARGLESYTMDINEYSDLTSEEFNTRNGLRPELLAENKNYKPKVLEYDPNLKTETSVNWVDRGYVTPIRNQGSCGSCWSFTTVAVIESLALIKKGKPINTDYSEQHFIECSSDYGNAKCQGGLMENTYNYMIKTGHGSQHEVHYPYISFNNFNGTNCQYDNSPSKVDIRVVDYVKVANDDAALAQAVSQGPVAVGVEASKWQNYGTGIYTNSNFLTGCGSLMLNHAVLVVGYTPDYWIIKNSWGTLWGEAGYMKLTRKTKNMCGITRLASYPVLA